MTATATANDFGINLRQAREAADLTRDRVARRLEQEFHIVTTVETIRRYEAGETNVRNVDLITVLGLARLYGVSAASLSPAIADRVKMAEGLLLHKSPWNTDPLARTLAA